MEALKQVLHSMDVKQDWETAFLTLLGPIFLHLSFN